MRQKQPIPSREPGQTVRERAEQLRQWALANSTPQERAKAAQQFREKLRQRRTQERA